MSTHPATATETPEPEPPAHAPRFHPLIEQRLHLVAGISSFEEFTPEAFAQWNAPYGPPEDWELEIEDREIAGPHGGIPVRIYSPRTPAPQGGRPCLVWLHGGAFVGGDLDMPEAHEVARGVAGRAGAVVVSVFYRLCPAPAFFPAAPATSPGREVRFPAPLDDVVTAFAWTLEHAGELGNDPRRVAIGGASAGGNLAAGATLRLAETGQTPWQTLLMYPLVHPELPEPTPEMAPALAMIPPALEFPPEVSQALNENYLGGPISTATPHAFAALAEDLSVFPPTLVDNCEFDSLRRSGEPFAAALAGFGVEVEAVLSRGVPHGHLNCLGLPAAHASMDRMAARLQRG